MAVKMSAFAGCISGILAAAYFISKGQSSKLGQKVGMFNIQYGPKEILALASASVAGGTLGGLISDKKQHKKAKLKEALHQMIGNIITPLAFIVAAEKLYSKVSHKIKLPQLPSASKFANTMNPIISKLPNFVITLGGLISGVFVGTEIASFFNSKLHSEHCNRKVKPRDFAFHIDDLATTFAIIDEKGAMRSILGKVVPIVFTMCGYEAGTKR
ncbi:MAG: hypothetical protein PHX18_00270 [Candidatus Gastranaerophilales bacterium]|nr:hypothetical protein [Candidatus Gastranaerophilales bacterium]